jgi:hypothetical protein
MEVQSLMFDRELWTLAEARAWLRQHGYRVSRPDAGPQAQYYKFRQAPPEDFRFIRVGNFDGPNLGIKARYGCPW